MELEEPSGQLKRRQPIQKIENHQTELQPVENCREEKAKPQRRRDKIQVRPWTEEVEKEIRMEEYKAVFKRVCLYLALLFVAGSALFYLIKTISEHGESTRAIIRLEENQKLLMTDLEKTRQLLTTEQKKNHQLQMTELKKTRQLLTTEQKKNHQLLMNLVQANKKLEENQQLQMTNQEKNQQLLMNEFQENRPSSCAEVITDRFNPRPVVTLTNGFKVVCDTVTDGGGWVVLQRRVSGTVDFYRNWDNYRNGFGDLSGSFWLGLETTYQLVSKRRHELQIEFVYKGTTYIARYSKFYISGEPDNYKLQVSGFSGNCGDSLDYHNNMAFSTYDKDNDVRGDNCAQVHHGAWWYRSCHYSNLNGLWASKEQYKGVNLRGITGDKDSATYTEIKFRPFYE